MKARYWPCRSVNLCMRGSTKRRWIDLLVGKEASTMNVRYVVTLSPQERSDLRALVKGGSKKVRRIKRAQVLLAADAGVPDQQIATRVSVGTSTVFRNKQRFVEEGFEAALSEDPRPGGERKLTSKEEALLVAVACSAPPKGRARWTLELLAGRMVRLTGQ